MQTKTAPTLNGFLEEAASQNISLTLIIREEMTMGLINNQRTILVREKPIRLPDFAVVRTIDTMVQLQLEACGILCCNSSTVSHICNDKALSHHHIANLGIPMVDTIFPQNKNLPEKSPLPFPCVVKEVSGRGGKQVYFIQNQEEWDKVSKMTTNNHIIQSCNVQLGKDLRVFVVGNNIIGAVLRQSNNDFRANYKLGGTASLFHLSNEQVSMVQHIVDNFDFDMVGIDFLFDKRGDLLFNEIEDVVGSRILSAVTDLNIVKTYISHIQEKLKKRNPTI
ncbi:RimK family alpha-L-glutamate ligase [Virgibacillus sp. SK37]|uniref:ATP-grasp domain-containing protein n=1 Tax=Virgibacillus sp. SK37 TaxID=403957 RepID=UPI000A9D2F3D|nr:ATP-grasp domain-containing protein [Virgibacillus sp. SK37]